jgi:hypothetical protein
MKSPKDVSAYPRMNTVAVGYSYSNGAFKSVYVISGPPRTIPQNYKSASWARISFAI